MGVINLDWSLLQSFVWVAQAGSLSAAARAHGVSQPTLGRHIRALEKSLDQSLLTRTATGQALTDMGVQVMEHAAAMQNAVASVALAAAGSSTALEGVVRITAARIVAQYHLPPILARLRLQEPGIQIELVASDETENLLFGEADIALRMFRPDRGDLMAQKITELPLGLYAACEYLDRVGRPETPKALMALNFVGYDHSGAIIELMAANGFDVNRDFFGMRCEDQLVHWALVCAGCGVGGFQTAIGDADARVERIAPFVRLPALPVWLAIPSALRHVPRILRVRLALAEGLAQIGAAKA